jgi:hypothetical protein
LPKQAVELVSGRENRLVVFSWICGVAVSRLQESQRNIRLSQKGLFVTFFRLATAGENFLICSSPLHFDTTGTSKCSLKFAVIGLHPHNGQ